MWRMQDHDDDDQKEHHDHSDQKEHKTVFFKDKIMWFKNKIQSFQISWNILF